MYLLELGAEIKTQRKAQGLRQGELAELACLDRTTISKLEGGHMLELGFNKAERIVNALGLQLALQVPRKRPTLDDLIKEN